MTEVANMVEALREAGHEPYSYSGRGMYGRRCVAVDVPSGASMLELGYALGLRGVDPSEFGEAKTDNMGLGIVVYWPYAEWSKEQDNG